MTMWRRQCARGAGSNDATSRRRTGHENAQPERSNNSVQNAPPQAGGSGTLQTVQGVLEPENVAEAWDLKKRLEAERDRSSGICLFTLQALARKQNRVKCNEREVSAISTERSVFYELGSTTIDRPESMNWWVGISDINEKWWVGLSWALKTEVTFGDMS